MIDVDNLEGRELENAAQEIFTRMGLVCVHRLNQAQLLKLNPSGSYSSGEHLELDYLIPYQKCCIVGEITARKNAKNVERKHQAFRDHLNLLKSLRLNERIWLELGVPEEYLPQFREVEIIRGSFITTNLQKFDVDLPEVADLACFYKADWDLIVEYSLGIGKYSKYHFLNLFDIREEEGYRPLHIKEDPHGLMRTPNKKIASGGVGMADLYTFEASPYDLFPMARVYRRDMLPDLSSISADKYQRPLILDKLGKIRNKLLTSRDFMFPNSILVVLSNDCQYSPEDKSLLIPDTYGAISVIDGQHRLFSYADENVFSRIGENCKIMVTAIQFKDADDETIQKYSAKTFIEINTNQTRVRTTHLDAIAYAVLGDTSSRAIAAQIILQVNGKRGKLYGLFDTNQSNLGVIQSTTVLSELKVLTNLKHIQGLQRGENLLEYKGYQNLFGTVVPDLCDAESLIKYGVQCFEQYFNKVAYVFMHDWPERGTNRTSSLSYSKVFASFVKLLVQFISEGLDWQNVKTDLEAIKNNLMLLRNVTSYDTALFDETDQNIPNSRPSTKDNYNFLMANRENPTSIKDVMTRIL